MKCYHSYLIASMNHNCCPLKLLYRTDDSDQRFLDNKISLCLKVTSLNQKYIFLLLPVELFISLDCFGVSLFFDTVGEKVEISLQS